MLTMNIKIYFYSLLYLSQLNSSLHKMQAAYFSYVRDFFQSTEIFYTTGSLRMTPKYEIQAKDSLGIADA